MPKCPICSAEITDASPRRKCQNCGNADRTRALFLLYQKLRSATQRRKALVFTQENWLSESWFSSCEKSVYRGANHLDIQNIKRKDNSYSWIASNHVLEHVENDVDALRELYRILTEDGVLQITIPTPSRVYQSADWGYADPDKMGHYRNYGADVTFSLREALPDASILAVIFDDTLSPFRDVGYFILKSPDATAEFAALLFKNRNIVVPLPR